MSEVMTSEMDFPIVDQYISGDTPLTYLGVAPQTKTLYNTEGE